MAGRPAEIAKRRPAGGDREMASLLLAAPLPEGDIPVALGLVDATGRLAVAATWFAT